MAKRRKTKANPTSLKQQRAQHRKAFIRKVISLAEQLGVEDLPSLLTPNMQHNMFAMRIRLNSAAEPGISLSVQKEVRRRQEEVFNSHFIVHQDKKTALSTRDYLTVAQSLYFYILSDYEDAKVKAVLREKFESLSQWLTEDEEAGARLQTILWYITLTFCTLDGHHYWLTNKIKAEGTHIVNHFTLHTACPEKKRVHIDNIPRNVFRVGWAMPEVGPVWVNLDPKLFGDHRPEASELPVYIQSHALRRMAERLKGIEERTQHFFLFAALQNAEVVKSTTGKWLMPYRFQEHKLGYLLVDVIEGMVIVRTFLFVTMDSTPEGKALQESIGLAAVDKKYLAIDRFDTFVVSDIANHPDIKEHFVKIGCEGLFEFDKNDVDPDRTMEVASFMRDYLKTVSTEPPTFPTMLEELCEEEAVMV